MQPGPLRPPTVHAAAAAAAAARARRGHDDLHAALHGRLHGVRGEEPRRLGGLLPPSRLQEGRAATK